MKTERSWVNPSSTTCGMCKMTKLPLIASGNPPVLICPADDGWPPKLEPPR